MQDDSDEVLYALYKKKTEQYMKIAVGILAVIFSFVLYFLIYG